MKRTLIIFGGGGQGKEVLELARIVNKEHSRWNDIVFRDDMQREGIVLDTHIYHSKTIKESYNINETEYIIALGEPASKKIVFEMLKEEGVFFTTLISPYAQVSPYSILGDGVIVKRGAIISPNVRLGNNTTIQSYTAVGHDVIIGSNCQISTHCVVGGHTTIGDEVFVGIHCPIRDRLMIGDKSIISAGSVVLKDVPEGVTVMGNPARIIKKNGVDTRVFN